MPIRGHKFITKFLKPSLNDQRFGTRLKWLNEKYSIFQIQWNHKSASGWTTEDAEVFIEWDKIKGRFVPDDKERFTKSKQRFRAIIYKLIKAKHITEIPHTKCTKIYCFGDKENIPSKVISEVIKSAGNTFWEIPSKEMCTFDPEAVYEINENWGRSYLTDDQINVIGDHKYANLKRVVPLQSEDIVPDNDSEELNFNDTQCLHLNIMLCSSPSENKQGTFHELENMKDSNDGAVFNSQHELQEIESYGLSVEDLLPQHYLLH